MNFLAAYRRPSLILLISTFSAVTCAGVAQPRIPKAHSRTTLRPGLIRLDSSTTILVSAEEGDL